MKLGATQVVAITGASKGIGRATAKLLAARGVRLALIARSADLLAELEAELRPLGVGDQFIYPGDLCDRGQTDSWIAGILEKWGRIDALINNAGVGILKPIPELTDDDWDQVIETNLAAPFRLIRGVLGPMRSQGGGHIVNVASIAGEVGFATGAAYSASKFGLMGLSESLIHEARRDGVKVTVICPGSVDTRFDAKDPNVETSWKIAPEEIARSIVHALEAPDNTMVTKIHVRPTLQNKP